MGTGISKKGFSISIDERSLGGSVVEDSIEALLLGGVDIGIFGRIVRMYIHVQLLCMCMYFVGCLCTGPD